MLENWEMGLLGIAVSLIGGHVFARFTLWKLGNPPATSILKSWRTIVLTHDIEWAPHVESEKKDGPHPWKGGVPQWLIGACERLFITCVAGFSGVGVGAGIMIAWLGVKTAVNWQRREGESPTEKRNIIRASQVSTFAGFVSMLFALLGGWILAFAVSPTLPVKLVQ